MNQKVKYSGKYFNWQKQCDDFGAKVDVEIFKQYIMPGYTVIDFGCSGGFLLAALPGKTKIGIEINPIARREAAKKNIQVYKNLASMPSIHADVIISKHTLEHCQNPFKELTDMRDKLKKSGKLILVVPHERKAPYVENDINMHLFTWSELNLGNLVKEAGFKVLSIETRKTFWPPFYEQLFTLFGKHGFSLMANLYGRLFAKSWEVKVVATPK